MPAAGGHEQRAGSSESPSRASRTASALAPSSRAASEAVKPGGMCWTIRPPAPSGEGSRGTSSPARAGRRWRRRSRQHRRRSAARRARARGGSAAGRLRRPRGAGGARRRARRRRPCGPARPRTRPADSPTAGLATRSTAPSASASTARRRGRGRTRRRRRPARGSALPSRSARSTPIPSRPGMCRSSVITSGRCARHSVERLVAVGGRADHVEPRRPSASVSRRRMSRESSATTTRRAPVLVGAGVMHGPPTAAAARSSTRCGGEQALGVEQDHEAVARSSRSPRSCPRWRSGRRSSWSASTVRTSSTSSTITPA